MEPYDPGLVPGELGGVGEGLCPVDSPQPLTAATSDRRLQVSLPLPKERGMVGWRSVPPIVQSPSPSFS